MITKNITYSIQHNTNHGAETISSANLNLSITDTTEKQMYIIHRALIQQLHTKRQKNANTKTRSEVRGGGRKPWKQKGTGRARAGSTRSPLWRGGGVIFGPQHITNNHKINKKEKKLAIRNLIYNKFSHTSVINLSLNDLNQPSTKLLLNRLNYAGFDVNKFRTLLIVAKKSNAVYLSSRNLKKLELITANNINVLSLLKAEKVIITNDALNIIEKTYHE